MEKKSDSRQQANAFNPVSPHDALFFKALFYIAANRLGFPTTNLKGFYNEIPMKLIYQCMAIFFENCDSNSRLVVDEDDNGKFRLEGVKVSPRARDRRTLMAA